MSDFDNHLRPYNDLRNCIFFFLYCLRFKIRFRNSISIIKHLHLLIYYTATYFWEISSIMEDFFLLVFSTFINRYSILNQKRDIFFSFTYKSFYKIEAFIIIFISHFDVTYLLLKGSDRNSYYFIIMNSYRDEITSFFCSRLVR